MVYKKLFSLLVGILLLSFVFTITDSVRSQDNSVIVDKEGKGHYRSIQAAVDNVSDGVTIIVNSGEYLENLIINKSSITLKGRDTGAGEPIINGDGDGPVLRLEADGITVENFIITNSGFERQDAGIKVISDHNCIRVNNITQNNKNGVYLYGASNNTVEDNNITENNLDGVYLHDSSFSNTIEENKILKNHNGVYLFGSSINTIIDNKIIQNTDDGVQLDGSSNNTIQKNILHNNDADGLSLYDSSKNNTIQENNITENNANGVYLRYLSNNNTIKNNEITKNNEEGIKLEKVINNTIKSNQIQDNRYGLYLKGSNGNLFYLNNLKKYKLNIYSQNSNNTWKSPEPLKYTYNSNEYTNHLGNYYNDYTGIDTDNDGIGETNYNINENNQDTSPLIEPKRNYNIIPYKTVEEAIAGTDGEIGDLDILNAIDYWSNNEEVPDTGGKTISNQKILDLIDLWITN